jgi:tetratricopeptide (TPR) repeat protein
MRRLSQRSLVFLTMAVFALAARVMGADEPGLPTLKPSAVHRADAPAGAEADDRDAIRYPGSDAHDQSAKETSTSAKQKQRPGDHANSAASKTKPIDPLQPVVDPLESAPVAIEATSFKGVAPGTSTQADVAKVWGPPKKASQVNGSLVQLYSIEPFKRIEVNYVGGKVSSIVIRLDRPFPVDAVAKHLDLAAIRAVVVFNELGEVLGRAYPERGVLLAFQAADKVGKSSMKVSQIILEPISAEPFVLRAEMTMTTRSDLSRRDLEQAMNLDSSNARAQWLYSRVMAAAGQREKSAKAASEAVRLDPDNAQYRVTYAQALAEAGQLPAAIKEVQKALAASEGRPHIKARAMCLFGDLLASGAKPDFHKALRLHTQAVQLADSLSSDPHPAIRVAAKEVLIDAHLSAAHDIAWGDWKDKPKAVERWLDRAAAVATDTINSEGSGEEQLFHVYTRSLGAYVGVRGEIDPSVAAKSVVATGEKLIAAARDPQRKTQLQWELGMALYDAVQVCQMRSEPKMALKYGESAAKCLADLIEARPNSSSAFLLGRLYFRMGTIHAMQDRDHKSAVEWFEKAIPLMEHASPEELAAGLSRQGEAFVSMGVSYWETGRRERAVALTQEGIKWMEEAVKQGTLERSSLAIPYGNLAVMHRKLGANNEANRFQEMASQVKNEKLK